MSAFLVGLSLVLSSAPAVAQIEFTSVTDQGNTLQCWAVALGSRLDITASREHGAPLKISPKYLMYAKSKAEVLELITSEKFELYESSLCEECEPELVYYEQGAILLDGIETARVYGAIPEQVYGGFPEEDLSLFRELNRFIAYYANFAPTHDLSSKRMRARIESELTIVLDHYLRRPPAQFTFAGHDYTPKTFFNSYLRDWRQAKARELNYAPGFLEATRMEKAFNGSEYQIYTTGKPARLKSVVSESLKAKEPVLLQYKAYDDYRTQAKGRIGFAIQGLPVVRPTKKRWNDPELLTHYVLAIGGEWDAKSGELKRILVKNTWGVSAEENFGFHWMEEDFLPWLEAVEIIDRLEPSFVRMGLLPSSHEAINEKSAR